MLRFALAYQGNGTVTYLAAGSEIDLRADGGAIDIEVTEQVDQAAAGIDIDLLPAGIELEVTHDGNGIDLQG